MKGETMYQSIEMRICEHLPKCIGDRLINHVPKKRIKDIAKRQNMNGECDILETNTLLSYKGNLIEYSQAKPKVRYNIVNKHTNKKIGWYMKLGGVSAARIYNNSDYYELSVC